MHPTHSHVHLLHLLQSFEDTSHTPLEPWGTSLDGPIDKNSRTQRESQLHVHALLVMIISSLTLNWLAAISSLQWSQTTFLNGQSTSTWLSSFSAGINSLHPELGHFTGLYLQSRQWPWRWYTIHYEVHANNAHINVMSHNSLYERLPGIRVCARGRPGISGCLPANVHTCNTSTTTFLGAHIGCQVLGIQQQIAH